MRDNKRAPHRSHQSDRRPFQGKREKPHRSQEVKAVVLDYYEDVSQRRGRAAYVTFLLGCQKFSLLKGTSFKPLDLKPGDIIQIRATLATTSRIDFKDLSSSLQENLGNFVQIAVTDNEKRFVEFFNTARPITTRLHSLQLVPGIGNKRMWSLLESRKARPFESFADLKERGGISDPVDMLTKRILQEIHGEEKYRLFCK